MFGGHSYELARWVFLRLLGLSYLFAYYSLVRQVLPLLGEDGLTPAGSFLDKLRRRFDSLAEAFWQHPTLFWFHRSDRSLYWLAWSGVLLSLLVTVGFANGIILFVLWFLYLSFVHIGQVWYGYGWESQLVETGFLGIFMVPVLNPLPQFAMPVAMVLLLRWLVVRINLGSGLIKLKADECWKKLTCLFYHFETQPIPNPLSPYFHYLPKLVLKAGTAVTHATQLVLPLFALGPRPFRLAAGIGLIGFQLLLMLSGNLSFLNLVTIAPTVAFFDDQFFSQFLPRSVVSMTGTVPHSDVAMVVSWTLLVFITYLSIPVVQNLFSRRQAMNASFNQWKLVNTYGAFGSVGQERKELVVKGTQDTVVTSKTEWQRYEFPAKPTDTERGLPVVASYQPRVDWQIWFAAMQRPERNPWLLHLVWKLLHQDEQGEQLIADDPFEEPPEHIKIDLYVYEFAPLSSEETWEREYRGEWLPPVSKESLRSTARRRDWTPAP